MEDLGEQLLHGVLWRSKVVVRVLDDHERLGVVGVLGVLPLGVEQEGVPPTEMTFTGQCSLAISSLPSVIWQEASITSLTSTSQ